MRLLERDAPLAELHRLRAEATTEGGRLVFVERWESAEALHAHFAVPESRAFAKEIGQLAVAPPSIEVFNASAVRS